jgi:phosphohistidine phosphatase SixA
MELYLRWLAKTSGNPTRIYLSSARARNTEESELLELDAAGIHVAEYMTVLPSTRKPF